MNISKQIGWSNESNLLYQILKQLTRLTSVMFNLKPKYKVFTALVTQTGSESPVALVLENTLGDITFGYVSPGNYQVLSDGLFLIGKTTAFVTTNSKLSILPVITQYQVILEINESNQPYKLTLYTGDVDGSLLDDIIQPGYPATVEIRVYN